MSPFFDVIASVLAYCYAFWNNYAWAITAFTLVIMIVLTPLTLKGTRSMMVMQQLQPEMKKIQTRYKDDRQKQNEELLKFYKENDINPLGGCLPLFVQMPVFFVLYEVLRGLTRRTTQMAFNFGYSGGQLASQAAVHAPPAPVIPTSGAHCAALFGTPGVHSAAVSATPGACFDPSYIKHTTDLYQALSHSTTMKALGMDLAVNVRTAVSSGAFRALPYILLIVIVGVTGWVQQKQVQGRQSTSSMPQQQQAMMKIMPFFLPVISIGLAAGLVLYFAVSNVFRVGQQWFIGRSLYGPAGAGAGGVGSGAPGGTSGGGGSPGAKGGGSGGGGSTGGRSGSNGKGPSSSAGGRKPKQGRLAAALSTAAAKAEEANQAREADSAGKPKNPGRPSSKAAKVQAAGKGKGKGQTTATTSGSSPDPAQKAGADKTTRRSTSSSAGSSSTSGGAGSGPPSPVLQPRARRKKKEG